MTNLKLLEQFRMELRAWILHEDRAALDDRVSLAPDGDLFARHVDVLVAMYVALARGIDAAGGPGFPPTPDMLLKLGWPGALIHAVACETAGAWAAFRAAVARRHSELPYPTPLTERGATLASIPELLVFRALWALPGVSSIVVHPPLPGGSGRQADFLVRAASQGKEVYVEVLMVASDTTADTAFHRSYRERWLGKREVYRELGLEPVVIPADELVPPRALAVRTGEMLGRLGLPSRPLLPQAWFEAGLDGEAS